MRSVPIPGFRYLCLVVAGLAAAAGSGCGYAGSARMWADSALPAGRFSTQARQWVYDGEPVTFELECDRGAVDFVVFGVDGDETVVSVAEVEGRYRWTRAFHCGPEPRTFEVYAMPFLLRGKCDWVYDKVDGAWRYYPGRTETPDVQTAREQTVRVTCYRKTLRFRFRPRGGEPTALRLVLTKADGERTEIRHAEQVGEEGTFSLSSLDDGVYTLACSPTHNQVSRAGTTHAELVIRHADGSTERLEQDLDTP